MKPPRPPSRRHGRVLALAGVLALLVAATAFAATLYTHHAPRKIADLPGPTGTPGEFQLWYARNGDLTFRPASAAGPSITHRDYYHTLDIAHVHWPAPDHVLLTLRNGTTLDIRSRFDVTYK